MDLDKANYYFENSKPLEAFEYGGSIFKGDRIQLIKEYIADNPSLDFYCWLVKKGRRLVKG